MYNDEIEASFRSSFLINTKELQSEFQDFVEEMDNWSHNTEHQPEELIMGKRKIKFSKLLSISISQELFGKIAEITNIEKLNYSGWVRGLIIKEIDRIKEENNNE